MIEQNAASTFVAPAALRRTALADDLHEAGFAASAVRVLAPVVREHPEYLKARLLLGIALADAGRIGPAIAVLREVVRRVPHEAAGWTNLGMLLNIEGCFTEAIAACDRAVALQPDNPQIRLNRAVVLLRAGRMAEAWPDYEARLRLGPRGLPAATLLPSLSELPDGAGRTVLVLHEEGFGDTLQFLRYVPMLAERGFRVLVCVPPELAPLVRLVPGIAELLPPTAAVPAFDFHCPFFSLPRAFGTTIATIPAPIPYLAAAPDRVAVWRERLAACDGLRADLLKVGLAWAGQARPWLPGFQTLDHRRSMSLSDLAPLAGVRGASFVSLQKGAPAGQIRRPSNRIRMCDPMQDVNDFAETAAIIANLDVIVSVDTSVVHLAAALGKPVLMLDRYDNCWRWMSGRDDSPWYPTLRIFRQERIGAWAPVVRRVADALREWPRSPD